MTSVFPCVIEGDVAVATLEETFLTSWTAISKKHNLSDLFYPPMGELILFHIEFLSLMSKPYMEGNYELAPAQRCLSHGYYSPADHFVLSCLSFC